MNVIRTLMRRLPLPTALSTLPKLNEVPKIVGNALKEEGKIYLGTMPYRAKLQLERKVENGINNNITGLKAIPRDFKEEFRRQSVHQTSGFNRPYDYCDYDYFGQSYQQQQQRYTPTPIPNLAHQLHILENNRRLFN